MRSRRNIHLKQKTVVSRGSSLFGCRTGRLHTRLFLIVILQNVSVSGGTKGRRRTLRTLVLNGGGELPEDGYVVTVNLVELPAPEIPRIALAFFSSKSFLRESYSSLPRLTIIGKSLKLIDLGIVKSLGSQLD